MQACDLPKMSSMLRINALTDNRAVYISFRSSPRHTMSIRASCCSACVALCGIDLAACAATRPSDDKSLPLVLVAGATGGTGQEVVEQALAKGYRVRALVRDEAKARTLFEDRVQYAVGDVREPRTLRGAVRGVDYVVSALGSNGQRDPENSAERVESVGGRALARGAD